MLSRTIFWVPHRHNQLGKSSKGLIGAEIRDLLGQIIV